MKYEVFFTRICEIVPSFEVMFREARAADGEHHVDCSVVDSMRRRFHLREDAGFRTEECLMRIEGEENVV